MTNIRKAAAAAAIILSASLAAVAPAAATDEAAILAGEAFGDAVVADAAGYPDPILVVKWADSLGLAEDQRAVAEKIRDAMLTDAREIAPEYIRLGHELRDLFESGRAGSARVRLLTDKIAGLEGRLRFIHLDARVRMRFELTRDQLQAYNRIKAGES